MPEAIEAVGRMLDGYPHARKTIENSYIGTIAALLCRFPRSIAAQCADPVNGVARKTKFLPTVNDVVEWCEDQQQTMQRAVEFEERTQRQLRERAQIEDAAKLEPLEKRKAVAERVSAALAQAGMMVGDAVLRHDETPGSSMAKLGLTQAQWDALPNADPGHWERLMARHKRVGS